MFTLLLFWLMPFLPATPFADLPDDAARDQRHIDENRLADAVYAYAPKYADRIEAGAQAAAALNAERPGIPAELLLAIAYRESRWNALACPRKSCGGAEAWLWPEDPKHPPKRTKYICGVMQSTELSWADCVLARDLWEGYARGAASLARKLESCKKKGVKASKLTVCMLNGYRGKKASEKATLDRATWLRDYALLETPQA